MSTLRQKAAADFHRHRLPSLVGRRLGFPLLGRRLGLESGLGRILAGIRAGLVVKAVH
ncbi:MAG TPA: hypothetical protein PKA10_10360 [Selenomonadales bacterium]|nr:hypothetical protein [Selenomonadales bacterium]